MAAISYLEVDKINSTPASAANPLPVGNGQIATATVTITSGTSLSARVDLGTARIAGIVMPAAWDTANLTFQSSPDDVTYSNVYDELGNEKTVTAAAARRILATPSDWIGVRYIKVRSGTSGAAVNQTADRIVTLVLVP